MVRLTMDEDINKKDCRLRHVEVIVLFVSPSHQLTFHIPEGHLAPFGIGAATHLLLLESSSDPSAGFVSPAKHGSSASVAKFRHSGTQKSQAPTHPTG